MATDINSAKALATGAARMSKRILVSYLFDWILIVVIAALGGIFNKVITHTNHRPFFLQDPSLSYPYKEDTVTVAVLFIIALVIPGIITALVSLIFVPGPAAAKSTPKALIWRRKLWEWNTAWLGLALSLASAFMITEGLKDLGGKPRPYAIGKCNPDLNAIDQWRVGGLGQSFDRTGAIPIMVSSGMCQERDPAVLREIFASWPSGHSSFSWAGLGYLTLFICSKFGIGPPQLHSAQIAAKKRSDSLSEDRAVSPGSHSSSVTQNGGEDSNTLAFPLRNSAASPPIYLLLLAVYLPIGTAIFVCVSRYFDFHHHAIDIFSGAVLGAFTAFFSFKWYHMPIRSGNGWSWGARTRSKAFWVGVGHDGGWVGQEGWRSKKAEREERNGDIETGSQGAMTKKQDDVVGPGIEDTTEVEGENDADKRVV